MSRILLVYPRSGAHGGAEVVAAWMLQALRDEHELSVLAWEPPPLALHNAAAGTSVRPADFRLVRPAPAVRLAGALVGRAGLDPERIQRFAWLMRMSRRLRARHDLVISPFGEADLGGRGIQYVHEESWVTPFIDRSPRRPWMALAGFSAARLRANVTVANSEFTASLMREQLGLASQVIYPPAPGSGPSLPWDERENAVLAIGRMIDAKRLQDAVEIVERARAAGLPLRLYIAGRPEGRRAEAGRRIRGRVAAAGPWAVLHEDLPRAELLELAGRVRYGLHTRHEEPFGIAVAELARAGCLVLARRGGGVGEILGSDELLFDAPAQAAARLVALASDRPQVDRLRAHLASRAAGFGVEPFVQAVRALVDEEVARCS